MHCAKRERAFKNIKKKKSQLFFLFFAKPESRIHRIPLRFRDMASTTKKRKRGRPTKDPNAQLTSDQKRKLRPFRDRCLKGEHFHQLGADAQRCDIAKNVPIQTVRQWIRDGDGDDNEDPVKLSKTKQIKSAPGDFSSFLLNIPKELKTRQDKINRKRAKLDKQETDLTLEWTKLREHLQKVTEALGCISAKKGTVADGNASVEIIDSKENKSNADDVEANADETNASNKVDDDTETDSDKETTTDSDTDTDPETETQN